MCTLAFAGYTGVAMVAMGLCIAGRSLTWFAAFGPPVRPLGRTGVVWGSYVYPYTVLPCRRPRTGAKDSTGDM